MFFKWVMKQGMSNVVHKLTSTITINRRTA